VTKVIKTETGVKENSNVMGGFSVGILGDLPLSKKISFQPSLLFTQKGQSEYVESTSSVVRLNYMELPLNFIYKVPGKSGNFIFGLGPDLSYGLSGTIIQTYNGTNSHGDIRFGNSDD
jgi:Outer membrane protein beta-barrel domain